MIQIELSREEPWPEADWDALALNAARAAIERTPHGPLLATPAIVEISVRLKPTNVLSFPMVQPDLLDTMDENSDDGELLLGDIVLAHDVCVAEAAERGIPVVAHATHLIVHGTLHLLGYDHADDAAAEDMEAIERDSLAALGIADPYVVKED